MLAFSIRVYPNSVSCMMSSAQLPQVVTVLCSAYFLVKAMVWLNKSY